MAKSLNAIEKTIGNALSGKNAHVATRSVFDGLDWKTAGAQPQGSPYSIFQLLNHMSYWQDWGVIWLGGVHPPVPEHAAGGWPGPACPSNEEEWQQAIRRFHKGLAKLQRQSRDTDLLSKQGKHTRLGMLQAIASHNSYHGGQVVLLRQILRAWPPPSGGLTW